MAFPLPTTPYLLLSKQPSHLSSTTKTTERSKTTGTCTKVSQSTKFSVPRMFLLQRSLALIIATLSMSTAFTASVRCTASFVSNPLMALPLPTMEQLATDPFIKQVEHGFKLTSHLSWSSSDQPTTSTITGGSSIQDYLQAQLSHSDGIRGFMVSYLTADESPADQSEIPQALWGALQLQMASDAANDLVSLTCMNVIMPTAMVSMHATPELSAGSARTAERGIRILQALCHNYPQVHGNVAAILAVAKNCSNEMQDDDTPLHQFWSQFFEKWGYKERQREDIIRAMHRILKQE